LPLTSFEKAALSPFEPSIERSPPFDETDRFLEFGLRWSLKASGQARLAQLQTNENGVEIKQDGSPATTLERSIELMAKEMLVEVDPNAVLVGEETGGVLPDDGYAVAVDPIDGTWAFLAGIHTYAVTLAVYLERRPLIGFVASPASGEIGYSARGRSRLLKLGVFGEPSGGFDLPVYRDHGEAVLVNVHPGRHGAKTVDALYKAWSTSRIRMVRSTGGSPAWGLLDASKGRYVYANLWADTPSTAFDLAAGVLLVRKAGGEVVDLEGNPIEVLGHRGPFVAAIDDDSRNRIVEIVRESVVDPFRDEGGES
jgi:fructose-1,6-bisphosphatase/inositol monophosphatase family enzyme